MQVSMRGMPFRSIRTTLGLLVAATLCLAFAHRPLTAAPMPPPVDLDGSKGRETGLPVPRYVSVKSREARLRIGPSLDYGTQWVYTVPGLPMEILAEYGNWRQVRDCDGVSGWMHKALLSSKRTAVVGPWHASTVSLRETPKSDARVVAKLEARVRLSVHGCDGIWCNVDVPGHDIDGFIRQSALWGVYPNENIR